MAILTKKNRISAFCKLISKFVFLHDLPTNKKRRSYEKKVKEWVCDESRLLPREVQRRLRRLLESEEEKAKKKRIKSPVKDYLECQRNY